MKRRLFVFAIAASVLAMTLLLVSATPTHAQNSTNDNGVGSTSFGTVLTPVGNPTWKPVDLHVFTAPIGTAADGYAEFQQNQVALLPPPNHQLCSELGIGPGAPHKPPYNREIDHNLDLTNFRESLIFRESEFSPPNGVWAAWMVVPRPGTIGSSPDFSAGRSFRTPFFPYTWPGKPSVTTCLGTPTSGSFDVPPLTDQLSCPFSVDGHSHFPIFFADNASFGSGGRSAGNYEYRVTMIDTTGNGWSITVRFRVRPEN